MNKEQRFEEILNGNEKARKVLETFNKYAKENDLTDKQYEILRKNAIMFAMTQCKELVHDLANEIWEDVNK